MRYSSSFDLATLAKAALVELPEESLKVLLLSEEEVKRWAAMGHRAL
jgi:hypothetical protein